MGSVGLKTSAGGLVIDRADGARAYLPAREAAMAERPVRLGDRAHLLDQAWRRSVRRGAVVTDRPGMEGARYTTGTVKRLAADGGLIVALDGKGRIDVFVRADRISADRALVKGDRVAFTVMRCQGRRLTLL
jgi:cold shock CspA family protein